MSLAYLYIISMLVYHTVFVCNPQWSLVQGASVNRAILQHMTFLKSPDSLTHPVYLCFILYFSDMFYIQWFCNPLDLLNENKIQYNN
jgi:hypothetical protein